ncbi:SDR family oxidoreductase [Dickeya sp. CFBP 2040]|uniref:SDR family oxidoreductase n=1 Tax=Dickeya poaceiphila TaxID=568768 RepID=A0A5B8HEX2_9GAMM|nr:MULTISPECIES: SDR family oxidoreductase [Dickeya]NKI75054.1 SDR family oxidoreductase [Dickeya sp. CFBP 2040]QDX28436.1 SDR family oxidoreductase [Dickeya poaceiphila]
MKLENKRILLTGASSDLGQELALALAARGARLYLVGRNEQALLALQRRLPDANHHNILLADLFDEQDRDALAECFPDNARLDVLINNAALSTFSLFEDQSHETIHQQLLLNAEAPILLTHALLDSINAPGIIMNIGSTLGGIGYPGYSVYCASQFALRGFSEALHRELSHKRIKVLHLAPRAIKTNDSNSAINILTQELGYRSDSPSQVAEHAVNVLERESVRRWLGWPEKLFVRLNALLPAVVDNAIKRQLAVIQRYVASQKNR